MLQYFRSILADGNDALYVTKCVLWLGVPTFILGQIGYATIFSTIGFFIIYDSKKASSIPPQWIGITCLSTVAGLGSLTLLKLAPHQNSDEDAQYMWFLGTMIQKVWGIVLCYILYQDYKEQSKSSSPSSAFSKSILNSAQNGDKTSSQQNQGEQQLVEINVHVIAGRDLVAKDKNIFGRKTSSDPYVKVYHGSRYINKTKIIYKTLNPIWEDSNNFKLQIPKETLNLSHVIECHIFDNDLLSDDDSMGIVYIPIPTQHNLKVTKWYKVETGPKYSQDYCKNPTGDLYVTIEVRDKLRHLPNSISQRNLALNDSTHDISDLSIKNNNNYTNNTIGSISSSRNSTNAYFNGRSKSATTTGLHHYHNKATPLHTTSHTANRRKKRSALF